MNWETLKFIYREVLINKRDIKYHGDDCYSLTNYYSNKTKHWETNFHQDKRHGKEIIWYLNGNKHWEYNYHKGKRHGKCIMFDIDGNIKWEKEYVEIARKRLRGLSK